MGGRHDVKIIEALKEALFTSCDDAFYFSGDETAPIGAEYLLTVNAAKAIKELNQYFGYPYKIFLEHSTKIFATSCTPLIGKQPANNFLGYKNVYRSRNNSSRSGSIDIAVYTSKNGSNTPLCAIEVKGFNPSKSNVLDDLKRNAEFFIQTSPTGRSTLPFTAFIALHKYKQVWSDDKQKKNEAKVKARYEDYIEESSRLKKLNHTIETFTVRRGQLPDPTDIYIQQHGLQGDEDYQFVGVLVTTRPI